MDPDDREVAEAEVMPQPVSDTAVPSQNLGPTPPQAAAPVPTPQPAPAVPQPARRPPVNYQPNEPGWWLATDGLWYPPETHPSAQQNASAPLVNEPGKGAQTVVVQVGAGIAGPQQPAFVTSPPKSKVAAGLLGIFLGAFGAHRFYLGYTGIGVTMLLITLLSFFILAPITVLWGLIEGIVILCGGMRDHWGRPLT
jgi:TM2 domain-containing membrane protein YozV